MYLLRRMCFKYLEKGGQKLLKAVRYDQLIDQVLGNRMVIADPEEIELANRLLIIKKINIRRLSMELKQLKEFGKEVGLKLAQMNKMSDEDLVLEIIRNVEPKVQYSKELVAWYNDLDDSLFDQAEAEAGAEAKTTEAAASEEIAIDDIVEVVQGYTKKAELAELLEDNDIAPFFQGFDPSAYKLATQMRKAMIDHLKNPPAAEVETEGGIDSSRLDEILELIGECEDEDQLVEVFSEYQDVFDDMEAPDDIDPEGLQEMMINHVESKRTAKEEPEKPMTLKERLAAKRAAAEKTETKTEVKKPTNDELFDWWTPSDEGFNVDEAFAKVEELKMTELRKFAKYIGLTIGIGKKKDEILDLVANQIAEIVEGVGESTDTDKVTISKELINDAAKAKDREALVEMCDQLEIALNALQKKSVPGMKKKLLEAIKSEDKPAATTVKDRTKVTAKPTADQSVYSVMEEMVLAGKSEDAIVKKVSPIYKERGKSIIFIKKRVHVMVGVIKTDHGMDE